MSTTSVVLCQDDEDYDHELFQFEDDDEDHDHDHHVEDHDHGHGEHDDHGHDGDHQEEASRGPYPVGVGPATTIVTYLGTDFILPNGCHLPKCEGTGRAYTFCRQDQLVLEKKYNDCLA